MLITRQAKADGPSFFLLCVCDSYWQSALSSHNMPEAEESTTSNVNISGKGALNAAYFTLTTVTMFNKLVLESPGVYTPWNERDCLSPDWHSGSFRFSFVFIAAVLNGHSEWHPLQGASLILCVCVCTFGSKDHISATPIYLHPKTECVCRSMLSDFLSCVKMVGRVSDCERPLAISCPSDCPLSASNT